MENSQRVMDTYFRANTLVRYIMIVSLFGYIYSSMYIVIVVLSITQASLSN